MTLATVLGVIFIVLKLVGVITWSWWLVLLPFYIGLVIWAVVVLIGVSAVGLSTTKSNHRRFRR